MEYLGGGSALDLVSKLYMGVFLLLRIIIFLSYYLIILETIIDHLAVAMFTFSKGEKYLSMPEKCYFLWDMTDYLDK